MFFTSATAPGKSGVPNEDWVAATSDLIVVLDGATIRTDTGCHHGVPWYTRKLGAGIIAGAASRAQTLTGALADAISSVRALHPECNLDHPGTPSAAVGILRLEDDKLRYAVLADISIVLDIGSEIVVISDARVSQTASAERREADKYLIGSAEKQEALVAMKHKELAARNKPGGYWIAAADPNVVSHALVGEYPRSAIRRLAVLSDGAVRAVEMFGLIKDWKTALDMLEADGPEKFILATREAELADPVGQQHPRNKRSDDATAVFASGGSLLNSLGELA